MHELGLCEAIVDAAESRAAGRQVRALSVRVGGAHALDEEGLRQAMAMVAAGTLVEDAAFEVHMEPVRVRCGSCGAESAGAEGVGAAVCPRCHGVDVELVAGDVVVLERMELEPGPEDPATSSEVAPQFANVPVTERSNHAH